VERLLLQQVSPAVCPGIQELRVGAATAEEAAAAAAVFPFEGRSQSPVVCQSPIFVPDSLRQSLTAALWSCALSPAAVVVLCCSLLSPAAARGSCDDRNAASEPDCCGGSSAAVDDGDG
jgi:hypothetical protein